MTNQSEKPVETTTPAAQQCRRTTAPLYRTAETADAYVVTAQVPGVSAADLETTVNEDKLVMNARRSWTAPQGWTSVHREISQADFRLVLMLDRRVNRDGIKAQLSQGVLTLTLPKAEEIKPRRIDISA